MADEDKEKAEKLAAAKKRFEQLKKEQQKKGKKAGSKKKDEKDAETKVDETVAVEDGGDAVASVEEGVAAEPSVSAQSKQRSESFRHGTAPAISPGSNARLEELEKENTALKEQQAQGAARLAKAEEELESLREDSGDLSELRSKAQDAERLQAELATTQQQLVQVQQSSKGLNRRVSGASPDVTAQLASKTSAVETLELEISTFRNQLAGLETKIAERDASTKELEDRATAAEAATGSAKQELDALKVSMAFPSEDTKAANEDPEALTKRISVLESDLRTATLSLDAAAKRATSLEQKIEALTKLHREATASSQNKDKELAELRNQLKRRDRPSHVRDASEFELGEEETETGSLQARIRALEAENFDLRRNVWREKRAEMQPGMGDEREPMSAGTYEDVDLNGPYTPKDARKGSGPRQGHSTFQDLITSGISAFTGQAREQNRPSARSIGGYGAPTHARQQSLGLLSEDGDDFDPEAFELAQQQEAMNRIERVKEVKRGLEKWKGWRLDLTEQRQQGISGRDCGPVFEV